MKKIFLSFLLFCTLSISYAKIDIERIDPPFWWTGIQDRELQIMLYGKNIADCKIKIDYPGVTIIGKTKCERHKKRNAIIRV